jgi:hypothetical protein
MASSSAELPDAVKKRIDAVSSAVAAAGKKPQETEDSTPLPLVAATETGKQGDQVGSNVLRYNI